MQTYLVIRRAAWTSAHEQQEANARSTAEATRMTEEIASIRSYVLEERDRSLGSVCIYEASTPEAIRRHATAAGLPVDEIVKVAEPMVGDPCRLHPQPERGDE